ncbi:hypothetical protein JCM11251_003985 [Rhodosporidiobolus azoricus]
MDGVAITDSNGRVLLQTHFPSSLAAKVAIDAAVASTAPVLWVAGSYTGSASNGGEDSSSDEEDGQEEGWGATADGEKTKAGPKGTAVCQIRRGGVRYIAPISQDVDPLVPLTFLTELHEFLANYISGPVTEASLKDHFDIVLALLQEMVSSGRPQLSQASQLRDLVHPPSELLTKVALNAVSAAGLAVPSQSTANQLLSSPIPWRRQGIKYASNEIYLDLLETLSFVLLPSGKPLTGHISGSLSCRSRLTGMPDLALTFTDPSVLEEGGVAFHECVRYGRWGKDKVVSFVPPDGSFPLLTFLTTPPISTSPGLTLALLPFTLTSSITLGSSGSSISLTLTSRTSSSSPLTNLLVRIPLCRGASGLTANVSGGEWKRDEEGRSVGGGAGRWDLVTEPPEEGREKEGERTFLVWSIERLGGGDRPAVLTGQYYCAPDASLSPSFSFSFDSPTSGFSGLRVNALKVASSEQYNVYKGVKTRGRGEVEVRTTG